MNKKLITFAIFNLLLLTSLATIPISGMNTAMESSKDIDIGKSNIVSAGENPWTPEDEGDHFPCGVEWWCYYVTLETENGTHLDVSSMFQYETKLKKDYKEIHRYAHLLYYVNRDTGDFNDLSSAVLASKNPEEKPFTFKKNMVDLKYHNCTMKGLYPNYTIHLEDKDDKQRFNLDVHLNAVSLPRWAFQEQNNGYLPWGIGGCARYGYIPRCDVHGNITINGIKSRVTGVGYHEHLWGNITYNIPSEKEMRREQFIKNFPQTMSFLKQRLSERPIKRPQTITFTTDNFFGYDWAWAAFDNGASSYFFAFHFLDFITEGPISGPRTLTFTPDGNTYIEFTDINIKYKEKLYIKDIDAYLPLDIEITATKGNKTLYILLNTTIEGLKVICPYPASRFLSGLAGIHTIGVAEGYYLDGEQNTSLQGTCTIGPYRQHLATKHNSLKIDILRPPQGLGFSVEVISHLLGFEMLLKVQLQPYRDFRFYVKPLDFDNAGEEKNMTDTSRILYVKGNGLNNYSKIQDAIDDADNGDTVFVYKGTYYENLLVNKSIHLVGENRDKVILDPGNEDGMKIIADCVEVTGFTIDGKSFNYGDIYVAAIEVGSSNNYIHNNSFINLEMYAMSLFDSSHNVIEHNKFIDNNGSIWLCRSGNNIIRYNTISKSGFIGMWLYPFSNNNDICHNNFIDNKKHIQDSYERHYNNKWDMNYWDDYKGLTFKRLMDLNKDGIGNIPYHISRFIFDRHPMMEPYEI